MLLPQLAVELHQRKGPTCHLAMKDEQCPSIRFTALDLDVGIISVDLNSVGIYPAEGALLIVLERGNRRH